MNENCNCDIGKSIIKRLEDIGRAKQKLDEILHHDLIEGNGKYCTSKHSNYWRSEHEIEDDKLEDIRCLLRGLHDIAWELYEILDGDD